MALTASQQASRLFKKSFGSGETLTTRDFFEEPKLGREVIFSDQIWSQSSLIPTTAPSLAPGASSGVVQYFEKETLSHISGSTNRSYFSSNLIDAISFNYGDGTYNYTLYKNDGTTVISFGDGDWLVDTSAGLLTFYGTLPSGVTSVLPPKLSFYKYIGSKGVSNTSGTITSVNAGIGLTGGGTSSSVTLDISLSNNSGLTFSNNSLSVDFESVSSNLAGSGLSYSGGTLSVNVGNGLEIVSDTVYLGGTLSQSTVVNLDSNYISFFHPNLELLVDPSNEASIYALDATETAKLTVTASVIKLENSNLNEFLFSNYNNTIGDGSVNNSIVIKDVQNSKGVVYDGDYTSNFSTHSLITKGYVDSAISGFGAGTIAGVTAGLGLSGGGTANYITLDINLGINSGLTFSGDDIVNDTSILSGNGLTANGFNIDVNVNIDSLEIINDFIRLKDTITGDRTFQDSVTVNGNLTVNGTTSYVNTENLYVEDNIITLNATFSGIPFLNSGIEVIRGVENSATFIWNESSELWTAGLSGSEVPILLGSGVGLTTSGPTISLDLVSIVGNGLTQNGNVISLASSALAIPIYQISTPISTSGDFSNTGIALSNSPNQYSRIQIFVNGQLQRLGNGTFSNVDCYFSNDGGLSALSLSSLNSGDDLFWNSNVAGFELDSTDELNIVYES